MNRCYILFIFNLFLSFLHTNAEADQSDWIDPYDMSPVYHTDLATDKDFEIEVPKLPPRQLMDQSDSQAKSYLKRTINMILNAVHEDAINDMIYKGHLIFEIDANKYAKLHEFATDKFHDLKKVDEILSEILKKPSHAYLKEYFLSWCYRAFKAITSRVGIATICVLAYAFVIYKMMQGHFHFWYICKFLFINLVLFDFAFVWIRLYQKTEIDKLADTVKYKNAPSYCNPEKMTSTQVLWNLLSTTDKCKDYLHVTLTDIFWSVSPGDVLIEMFTKAITHPMKAIGPAIGHFVYGLYGALPWGVNIILLPIVLIFVMIMTCIFLSFILNIPIKFNFFHLISFSFGDHGQNTNGNILTGKSVEKLLDIVKDNNPPRLVNSTNANVTKERTITEEKDNVVKKRRERRNQKLAIKQDKKEHYEEKAFVDNNESIEESDIKKDGYESDIKEDVINNTDKEKIDDKLERKRKRNEGGGDM